jgi:outer membrane protein TolC
MENLMKGLSMFASNQIIRTVLSVIVLIHFTTKPAAAQVSGSPQHLTLQDAQARALTGPVVDLAKLNWEAARYHRRAAQADYFPKIDSTFANLHFNKFMGQSIQLARKAAQLPLLDKDLSLFAVTVTQPLTPLFKVRDAVQIARADERIAQTKRDSLNAEIKANVEKAYLTLLSAQRKQAAAEMRLKIIEGALLLASTSTLVPPPVTESHTAILETTKTLEAATSRVAELTRSLNALIALPLDTELELTAPASAVEVVSLPQATQQAIANNPEVIEAEQTVVKAKAAASLSKQDYIPQVAVMGGYIYQTAVPLLPRDFSYVGVVATLNIFDFGKRELTVRERNTQISMAENNLELVKAKLSASVQKTFFELQRMQRVLELTRQLVSVYHSGSAGVQKTTFEAAAAQADAEAEMFQAELDYRVTYAQLMRIINGQ